MRTLKESHLVVLAAVLLLALVLSMPATTAWAKTTERRTPAAALNDAWISSRIEFAYFLDTKLNTFDVDVDVRNGDAYVIGYVPNEADREDALNIAENTHGVKNVVDRLMVDPDYKTKLAQGRFFDENLKDYWLSREVKAKLLMNHDVAGTRIGVEAEDGVVTLRGSVPDMSEVEKAEEVASEVSGVKEVKNKIICCRM